ncbi:FAD binding domain-containing protein [Amaricoccus tamworthensis]|uniref:FAD binding domain-containing protein n=1 Tax=Amaricoccus tamworthensis TaxID=57002 RepID=UPI003C7E2716
MYNFDFVKPSTVDEAVAALADEDAQALGGGQTLIPTLKQRLAMPSKLVSLKGIDGLDKIFVDRGGNLVIGAAATHAQVAATTDYPALASLAARIGDPAVRNRGTIGGSLANNDPSACYPAGALGSGATIVTNSRSIEADDFFEGLFETALEEGEIITEVRFPIPEKACYMKFIQPASRFPLTAVFVAKFADGVRVAVTGASNDGVFRWSDAEAALNTTFEAGSISELSVDADDMISDIHGSSEYRAHLVKVMTARAVKAAL